MLVRDALDAERLESIRAGCMHTVTKMAELDPHRLGNRGSHRYSFSSAPMHFGCAKNWASLVDAPVVLEVLAAIFESPDFRLKGIGGDFVLPGCVQYQHLHQARPCPSPPTLPLSRR